MQKRSIWETILSGISTGGHLGLSILEEQQLFSAVHCVYGHLRVDAEKLRHYDSITL